VPRPPIGRVVRFDPNKDPYRSYVADGLTPSRAALLLKSADGGDLAALLELSAELQDRDAHLHSVAATRKAALTLLDWKITSAAEKEESGVDPDNTALRFLADRAADYCAKVLSEIEDFDDTLKHLAEATISGLAVAELVWGGTGRLIDVAEVEETRLLADYRKGKGVRILTQEEPTNGLAAERGKFIVHMPRAKSGYPSRGPLIRPATLLYLIKSYDLKAWAIFCEVFGMPVRVATYGANATAEEKTEALEMLRLLGTDAVGIFSEAMKLELVESSGRGVAPYEKLIDWCDRKLSILILGQHLTTDTTGGTGTYAAAAVQDNVRSDLMLADRKAEAATLRQQLLAPMVRWRFGSQAPVPYFERVIDEPLDRVLEGQVLQIATQQIGLPVKRAEVYERLGFTPPEEGDEVIERIEQPAPAMPGFGGFGP